MSRRPGVGAARRAGFRGIGGGVAPAAPWTPSSLSSLAHWYRGTDVVLASTKITTMTDLVSSGGANATQGTDAARPVYSATIASLGSKPGAVFTRASTQFIRAGLFTAISQPFTIAFAFSLTSVGITQNICGGTLGNRYFIRSSASDALEFYAGGTTLTTTQTVGASTSYRAIFVFNGASSKARVNGVSRYSAAGNVGANTCGDLTLGLEASGTDFLDGSIAEAIVCSEDVIADAGKLASLEAYLDARYA